MIQNLWLIRSVACVRRAMIFDTDILIHIERRQAGAIRIFDTTAQRKASAQSWMEVLAGARNAEHLRRILAFPRRNDLEILPIDQSICHRALALMEECGLGHGLEPGDALIAATAIAFGQTLCTANAKHFRSIRGLKLKAMKF